MRPHKRHLLHCDHCGATLPENTMFVMRFIEADGALVVSTTTYIKPCHYCAQPGKKRVTIRPYHELAPLFHSARVPVDTKVS